MFTCTSFVCLHDQNQVKNEVNMFYVTIEWSQDSDYWFLAVLNFKSLPLIVVLDHVCTVGYTVGEVCVLLTSVPATSWTPFGWGNLWCRTASIPWSFPDGRHATPPSDPGLRHGRTPTHHPPQDTLQQSRCKQLMTLLVSKNCVEHRVT